MSSSLVLEGVGRSASSISYNSIRELRLHRKLFTIGLSQPWVPAAEPPGTGQAGRHLDLIQQTKDNAPNVKIVFIGASTTQFWLNEGSDLWNSFYVPKGAFNYGNAGDQTQNVIFRIESPEFDGLNPKFIVLGEGEAVNDINNGNPPNSTDVLHGIREEITQLRIRIPCIPIIIISLTPVNDPVVKAQAKQINTLIQQQLVDNTTTFYVDIYSKLVDANDNQIPSLFLEDFVHFTAAGYQVQHNAQLAVFNKLLAA